MGLPAAQKHHIVIEPRGSAKHSFWRILFGTSSGHCDGYFPRAGGAVSPRSERHPIAHGTSRELQFLRFGAVAAGVTGAKEVEYRQPVNFLPVGKSAVHL